MTESEGLKGRELDRALAEAMGETVEALPYVVYHDDGHIEPANEPSILPAHDDPPELFMRVERHKATPADEGYEWLPGPQTFIDGEVLPEFHSSIDALVAGPEARLRAAGWFLSVLSPDGTTDWFAEWRGWPHGFEGDRQQYRVFAPTEAEARARAALAALKALAGEPAPTPERPHE